MKHWAIYFVKAMAVAAALGAFGWMVFAVILHYRTSATNWDYMPFIAGGLLLMFSLAILSKTVTQGAASVILPFVEQLRGAKAGESQSVLVPPQPAQPGKVVTVTPLPEPPDMDKP
jgi:type IV secretory pathway TrbF-like protein